MRASRRGGIDPFYVMEVMRAAEQRIAAGGEVLHLEVGQPSTPAPEGVIEAAHRALDDDVLGYTTAAGIEPLRVRIAEHYADWYDIDVDPDRILVTVGASGAFVLGFMAAFDAGDTVVVPSPGYPCYRNALSALGVEVVDLPTTAETRFQPVPDLLDELAARLAAERGSSGKIDAGADGQIDGLVLASPSNPSGTMLDSAAMSDLVDWCDRHDVRLVSDEIYHGITYEMQAATALVFDTRPIVVNSFSKYFSMTGWRLGWAIAPTDLLTSMTRLGQNVTISAPTLSQLAALAAFDCHEELQANVDRYTVNRQVLLDGLPAAGLDRLAPADGAFYVYADVSRLLADLAGERSDGADIADSQTLCARWLDELGVAATPGIDFDPTRGHDFVRFSFAGSTSEMKEAVRRLRTWAQG